MAKKLKKQKSSKNSKTSSKATKSAQKTVKTKKIQSLISKGVKGLKSLAGATKKASQKTKKTISTKKKVAVSSKPQKKAVQGLKTASKNALKASKKTPPITAQTAAPKKGKAVTDKPARLATQSIPAVAKLPPVKKGKAPSCQFTDCKEPAVMETYCRLHYMMAFQATQLSHRKQNQGKLKDILSSLSEKYPDEYIEVVKEDLSSEDNFVDALDDLDLRHEVDLESLEK